MEEKDKDTSKNIFGVCKNEYQKNKAGNSSCFET